MNRLYVVAVEYETVVYASSERAAQQMALDNADSYIHSDNFVLNAYELTSSSDIPSSWHGCIPLGEKKDRTVEQVLRNIATCDVGEKW